MGCTLSKKPKNMYYVGKRHSSVLVRSTIRICMIGTKFDHPQANVDN